MTDKQVIPTDTNHSATRIKAPLVIKLANPRGFCAGVERAVDIVNRALELFGSPIYVRHQIIHNRHVIEDLKTKGAVFVTELQAIPQGSIVIFSAHGVAKSVYEEAIERQLKIFDATCPLVTKVHLEVHRYAKAKRECILIGHKGHPEVIGTMGQFDHSLGGAIYLVESIEDVAQLQVQDPERLTYVSQTTLSVKDTGTIIQALRARFPNIQGPRKDDICYATQNRQDAVQALAQEVDLLLVIGSPNSSNSNRLCELGKHMGIPAYLIDSAADIQPDWLENIAHIGVTAGASAPESLVQEVVRALKSHGGRCQELAGVIENYQFRLPKELRLAPV